MGGGRHHPAQIAARVQANGSPLRLVADVDDLETTLEITARGLADTVANRGILRRMADRVPHNLVTTPLRPRMWDSYAIVHRRHTALSPATRAVLELAVDRRLTGGGWLPGARNAPGAARWTAPSWA